MLPSKEDAGVLVWEGAKSRTTQTHAMFNVIEISSPGLWGLLCLDTELKTHKDLWWPVDWIICHIRSWLHSGDRTPVV